MKRIIVIGCPGSGKSTFSKALHKITRIPLVHLDNLFWNEDKTTVGKAIFLERLTETLRNDEWIIDGNYASTMEMRAKECDTIIFLDYPLEVCLDGIKARRGKQRSDLPWIESGESDADFIEFIKGFSKTNRPIILELLDKYKTKKAFVLKSRSEADEFLLGISR